MSTTAKIVVLLMAGFVCIYLLTASLIAPFVGDGGVMLQDAVHVLQHGLAAPEKLSKYGMGQVFIDLPAAWLYLRMLDAPDGLQWLYILGISATGALLAAMTNILCFLTCLQLGYRRRTALAVTVILGLASMQWVYAQSLFADSTLGFCWLLGFYALLRFKAEPLCRWLGLAGAALGYSVLVKVTAFPSVALLCLYAAFLLRNSACAYCRRQFSWRCFVFLLPFALSAIVLLGYNQLRFGAPLMFGYATGRDASLGFGTPLLTGLHGLLLSPGKSLLLYNPALLLAIVGFRRFHRAHRVESLTILAVAVGVLMLHCKWWAWHGDWAWGPRFLVPALPFLHLYTAPWLEPLIADGVSRISSRAVASGASAAVIVASVLVQIPGLAVSYHQYLLLVANQVPVFEHGFYDEQNWPLRDDCVHLHFIPEFSPVAGHLWMARRVWHRGTVSGEKISSRPPWAGLNPRWVTADPPPDDLLRWNVWWMFLRQFRETLPPVPLFIWLIPLLLGGGAITSLACAVWHIRRSGAYPST